MTNSLSDVTLHQRPEPGKLALRQKGLTSSAPRCFVTRASRRSKGSPFNPSRVIGGRRRGMERSQATEFEFTLASIGIFACLAPKALKALRDTCSWQNYHPGDPIVDYLDVSDDVFFVTTGEVSVTIYSLSGKAVSFRNLGPGSIFGEYAAIDGNPRCASVVA